MDPRLWGIGLLVGLLIGLSGVGGSSLMTPLLIVTLRMNPLVAVGTDLVYSVPTKLLGAYVHRRQGTIDWRLVQGLCLGGVPAAVVGIGVLIGLGKTVGLSAVSALTKQGVGILLFVAAAAIIVTPMLAWLGKKSRPATTATWTAQTQRRLIILGAVTGFLVSLTSIGSGALTIPILYLLLPGFGLSRLVGSDVAFAAVLIPTAAIGHAGLGNVDFAVSANLLVGSLPGVFIGSTLCKQLPGAWLRPAVAITMVWAGAILM
jgi:uncharacterized membrane protein YfcA